MKVLLVLNICIGVFFFAGICCAQFASPGPYEILPFEEAFIIEAWKDLLPGSEIADWSGWTASSWVSPNAYNGHSGTDFAIETGTPLYAVADGVVVEVVTDVPENTHPRNSGNYVKINLDKTSPRGERLFAVSAHMLPNVVVKVGERVNTGDLLGYSDNTGNSTSEHLHFSSGIVSGNSVCPFYEGHFKYPVMFNPEGTSQVGHVIEIMAEETPIRLERFGNSEIIYAANKGQRFFASYWQKGYYRIFVANDPINRSGWVRAIDVKEVFEGIVIQPLETAEEYEHTGHLKSKYSIHAAAEPTSEVLGEIYFAGGRFVADTAEDEWYRIPVPGQARFGWVKADANMLVYPQLYNPEVNLANRPRYKFPISESFSEVGRCLFGRAKFNRSVVKEFSPVSPGGDGKAVFVTDSTNSGHGLCESVWVGNVDDRDYYAQVDVYFNYKPGTDWERYGLFIRDDGFVGLDQTFEGKGNAYILLYDSDDGRLRAGKVVEAKLTDFMPTRKYIKSSGWHTLKIMAQGEVISYYLDGELLTQASDDTFISGPCGFGYSNHLEGYPEGRGAWFDNFVADSIPTRQDGCFLQGR